MKKVLNSNSLKIIAILAMILDHVAIAFMSLTNPFYYILRIVGRITAPIMFYCLANGFFYTKNKFKYGTRLLLFAVVSQVPYSLFAKGKIFVYDDYNVLFTLFLAFMFLYSLYDVKKYIIKIFYLILVCSLSLFCEYGLFGIVLVWMFYMFRDSKYKTLLYSLLCFLYLIIMTMIEGSIIYFVIFMGLFLVVPLLNMDSGKKGKLNLKYLFYIFYPAHLIVLYLIVLLVS